MLSSSSRKRSTSVGSAVGPAVSVQWSYGAVWASTCAEPAGSVPSRANSNRLESIMHAASTLAATQCPGGVPFAADVVTVQPHADVEPAHLTSVAGSEPARTQ